MGTIDSGLQCPNGHRDNSEVIETRPTPGAIRRRRKCLVCSSRFTTLEYVGSKKLAPILTSTPAYLTAARKLKVTAASILKAAHAEQWDDVLKQCALLISEASRLLLMREE